MKDGKNNREIYRNRFTFFFEFCLSLLQHSLCSLFLYKKRFSLKSEINIRRKKNLFIKFQLFAFKREDESSVVESG